MAQRYTEENGSAAMLATKRLGDVVPETKLRECVTSMPPPSVNKAAYSGFETQKMSPEVQNRGISGPITFLKKDSDGNIASFVCL